jgi:hypothetical protein
MKFSKNELKVGYSESFLQMWDQLKTFPCSLHTAGIHTKGFSMDIFIPFTPQRQRK